LVKFFSAAQIATCLLLPQIREIYFSAVFPCKFRPFLNLPALGIGIALALATRLRTGMNRCVVQSHKPKYEEN